MQTDEYARMREYEDRYWWYVSRRRLALSLLTERTGHGSAVLDVGCGTGAMLSALEGQYKAAGLDFSELGLEFCRDRGLNHLVQGNAETLPFAANSWQSIVSLDTLEHVPDDVAALSEMFRVLKPGGTLVLNVPAFRWLWGPHDVALMHCRRYTVGELRRKLREAGFRVERIGYGIFLLFPLVVLIRMIEKFRPGPPRVSLPQVPDWANRLLIRLQDFEAWLLARVSLPWGSSVVAVAVKP